MTGTCVASPSVTAATTGLASSAFLWQQHRRPDYRKYLSPEILYIPYKWLAPQTPLNFLFCFVLKNPEKIPGKGHARARTLVEFKEKISRPVFHNMQITSESLCSHSCARVKIKIPMHSVSWWCPKIVRHCDPISLLRNTFGIHLEPGCKIRGQIICYSTAKNVGFAQFLDEFL